MGGRGAVRVAVALWAGMWISAGVLDAAWALWFVPAPILVLVSVARRFPRLADAVLLVAVTTAGCARALGHRERMHAMRSLLPAEAWVRIEGSVIEPPARESGEPLIRVAVHRSRPPLPRGTQVRLRLDTGTAVEWSDRIEALAHLDAPGPPRNPGGIDSRAVADASSTVATGRAYAARVERAGGVSGWPRGTFGRWRSWIEQRLERRLSPAARELVVPLVLGDRTGMAVETGARLRASGLVHLIALSGLHVSWMAAAARMLIASAGGGVRARAVAGAACALLYAGIAGPIPSLLRAAAAEILASLARANARSVDPLQTLAVSAILLLLCFPGWALDLGFQLSCAATLGLVTVGALPVRLPVPRTLDGSRQRSIAHLLLAPATPAARALVGSVGAQVVALPLLLARFHSIPWNAPAANLIAVPVSALLLAAAWIAVLVEGVLPGAGRPAWGACEALVRCLDRVVTAAASLPGTGFGVRSDGGLVVVAVAGAALLAVASPSPRGIPTGWDFEFERRRAVAACIGAAAVVAVLLLAYTSAPRTPPPGTAWLVVLDIGQGDAIALVFGKDWWLVDTGPRTPRWDAGEGAVLPFLRWAGVRRLERMVLTHADGDHTGGAAAILRSLAVGSVVGPPALPRTFGALGTRSFVAVRGDLLRTSPPVLVRWPGREGADADAGARSSDNATSLVLEIGSGHGRALLLADVDSTVENRIVTDPRPALLKVAHHGSGSSSGGRFLVGLRPAVALVSCGRRNAFGHPNALALARLRTSGAEIVRTDREGALWYELAPQGVRRIDWPRSDAFRRHASGTWPPTETAPAPAN